MTGATSKSRDGSARERAEDGRSMWPIAFALTELTAADEAKIRALVKRAVRQGDEDEVVDAEAFGG